MAKGTTTTVKPIALIQLSGGIDSAYVLYDWLKNNPNDIILVHHIKLINHEKRSKYEAVAVKKILEWLTGKGLSNFKYIESKFDYGGIVGIIKDVEVCNFFLGVILRAKRWSSICKIFMPIYKKENVSRQIRATKIRRLVSNQSTISEKSGIEVIYPIENKTKKEVMEKMPKELLELCWYCRKGSETPCGKCITCEEVK